MVSRCTFADLIHSEITKHFGEPENILELGCGCGGNLDKFPNSNCVGIDPCKKNIELATGSSSQIILGNHTDLTKFKTNKFDVGLTCSVLDHIENFEPALTELCRVCKKLILFEPIINEQPRQALKSETGFWSITWYHNYSLWLSGLGLKNEITHFPLYKKNSGPLYHKIIVDSEDYPKNLDKEMRPLIITSRRGTHNAGIHGGFLQSSIDFGINSVFYGPVISGVTGPYVEKYSSSANISQLAKDIEANMIILYRGHPFKDFQDIPNLIPETFTKSNIPIVLIDVDFCLIRGKSDFYSELSNIHFIRHPSDAAFSRCSSVVSFPFSVNPDIYTYASSRGREHICFSGATAKYFYRVRQRAIQTVKPVKQKGLTSSDQAKFYHKHIAGLTDNADPYKYLNAKHFEIPATGTILFTNGQNGVDEFLYPGTFVTYKDDCSDILSLLEDVKERRSYWTQKARIGSDHVLAKHTDKARWTDFILHVNSKLKTNFKVNL